MLQLMSFWHYFPYPLWYLSGAIAKW